MSPTELQIFTAISEAAEVGAPCPKADDLSMLIGSSSVSTTVGIIQRLERRGLMVVQRYQRGRMATIVSTGKSTAEPKNKAPHWRTRPVSMPAPSLSTMRVRQPEITVRLQAAARREDMDMGEFMARMCVLGFERWEGECG